MDIQIPDRAEILSGPLLQRGTWLVANLETSISWPVTPDPVDFDGQVFWLIPVSRETYPAVAFQCQGMERYAARKLMMRFLSAVSWSYGQGVSVAGFSGGALPQPLGREKGFGLSITRDLELLDLPVPATAAARLAIARMREARSLNHPGYAFLSFFRVLEASFPKKGRMRSEWMRDALNRTTDRKAKAAVGALLATGVVDVVDHLIDSRRKAVAHANEDPIIDPDDPEQLEEVRADLPIIEAIAELAIEEVLGVPTRSTVYRQHLYELRGFKDRLGADLVADLTGNAPLAGGQMIDLPAIDVELRKRPPYPALKGLQPTRAGAERGAIQLLYQSPDNLVSFELICDFREERLRFDPDRGFTVADDGSERAAEHAADGVRFIYEYLSNGRLNIFDAESRELLSRVDAFIPLNSFPNTAWLNAEEERWRTEAARRRRALSNGI